MTVVIPQMLPGVVNGVWRSELVVQNYRQLCVDETKVEHKAG